MQGFIYEDGVQKQIVEGVVPILERSFHFGDNCFEGILLIDSKPLFLKEHLDRLYTSAKYLHIDIPSNQQLTTLLKDSINHAAQNGISTGYIRIILSRGVGDLGIDPTVCHEPKLRIIISGIQLYPEEKYEKGISLHLANYKKIPVESLDCRFVKHGNYLQNILSKYEARKNGFDDALMLTVDNFVSEATVANIFAIYGNILYTPSLENNCLSGITREAVIKIANKNGFTIEEGKYNLNKFIEAEELFLTGTAAGILPVSKIGTKIIGTGIGGDKTMQIRKIYLQEIAANCTEI